MDTKTIQQEAQQKGNLEDFTYSFQSPKSSKEIYEMLLQLEKWWSGLYEETITGQCKKLGDEFDFQAGRGVHYTKQKLVELTPSKKVTWEVTDCNLQFVKKQDEWVGTRISFEIEDLGTNRRITFRHLGLTPKFECYGNCAGAWTEYMNELERKLS